MKIFKTLKNTLRVVFLLFVILGILIIVNDDEGTTARVIEEAKPVLQEAAQDIDAIAEKSGLKDKAKEKIVEAKDKLKELILG
ncbi:hypothetical protein HQ533_04235 [Candidatus Woesearchaeota archaeon]|nr:hypothetical protein [Candidatus Woesearchaeota archaeon]